MESLKSDMEQLRNKPEPQPAGKRFLLIAILGIFVIVVGGALLLWQVLASQAASTGQKGVVSAPTTQPTKSGPGDPQAYYDALKQYVAQQLHMSEAQIKTKLQARVSLVTQAEQQGISAVQLRTILLEAEQKGHDVLVQKGYLTQQESDAGMQDLRTRTLQTLETSISYDFLDD